MSVKRTFNPTLLLLMIAAALFWGVAVIGAVKAYSPVPYWDMWNGYLNFYIKTSQGDWSTWWAQHNEHRILLARLFFWLDFALFNGDGWFLLCVNYSLLALAGVVFWFALQETRTPYAKYFGVFVFVWLASWAQHENLTWGFQSQFILAQLLPLSAFFVLFKAASNEGKSSVYFIGACILGLLSFGTMANGVLALPLMVVYALVVRLGWLRVVTLAILAGLGLFAYFHNYIAPQHDGSLGAALKDNPVGLVHYVLLYIGGPFSFFVGKGKVGGVLALVAGLLLVVLAAFSLWRAVRDVKQHSLELALLAFILYVGGTAFGTAGGRLIFGVQQALASRYMTPALMAWAALFVLYLPWLARISARRQWLLWVPLSVLILAMVPMQLRALQPRTANLFERDVAALAIEMGVKDKPQISHVFPFVEAALAIGVKATAKDYSIFGHPSFKDVHERIGKPFVLQHACQGSVDQVKAVEDEGRYMSIGGWLFDPAQKRSPKELWIIDKSGVAVGYALAGQSRPDVAKAVDGNALDAGFKGYFLTQAQGKPVSLFDPDSRCVLPVTLPVAAFKVDGKAGPEKVTVKAESVVSPNTWGGTDSFHSNFKGLKIYGSFVRDDSDTGTVSVRLKRGDRILYRSGPTAGNQVVTLDNDSKKITLPVSLGWVVLDFSSHYLPEQFLATFKDEGSGWGEWAAIAVMETEVVK
jgi:hypothetical protein